MKKHKTFYYIVFALMLIISWQTIQAQEISAKVTVLSNRITTQVDKRIFNTLQTQLNNLLNNRKWTEDNFKVNERIECNFVLNLDKMVEQNVYTASLIIQAARPVFNSSYQSPLINWQDNDIRFRYVEFQPVEFNENRLSGSDPLAVNLPAIFAYYVNMILGVDYNSFSIKGGMPYFKKALFIVNNAPSGNSIYGWSQFDGLRNRYWLAENLMNERYTLMHDAIYQYYRNSLDYFYDDERRARDEMMNVINLLHTYNTSNQNTMVLQFFMQSKSDEIIEILKKAPPDQRQRAVAMLEKVDVTNAKKYRDQLK
ncbi:MAG: DUF4835 family protein [Bacteroidetes bacterium]|jgi:hypothetical protein|uniref:type IX secretion system protein PorD n=1 Tax=Phnomibacter sp. TaxID=2836217 RepID=UPI002FDD52C8|nr:DUF4835 family protein [Bacteroidota bacterium]